MLIATKTGLLARLVAVWCACPSERQNEREVAKNRKQRYSCYSPTQNELISTLIDGPGWRSEAGHAARTDYGSSGIDGEREGEKRPERGDGIRTSGPTAEEQADLSDLVRLRRAKRAKHVNYS